MKIIEDTRNQQGKHILLNEDLTKLGHEVIRSKLYVGDYSRLDNMQICIDTKKDWIELAGNICGKQHQRFREECKRAREAGIQLVVLVEEACGVEKWTSPVRKNGKKICHVEPLTLSKAMKTMAEKYGVRFIHCSKVETANMIIKILGGKKWQENE